MIGARSAGVWLILGALLIGLGGCGGASRATRPAPGRHAPPATRTRPGPVLPEGPAPPVRQRASLPVGPVRMLLRHLPAGTSGVTLVDLQTSRAVLGLRATANPFAPGQGETPSAARELAALARIDVNAPVLVNGIDFSRVTAILRFPGRAGSTLLLRVQAPRRAIVRRLRRQDWRWDGGVLRRRRSGGVVLAPFGGGVAVGTGRQAVLAVAHQKAVAAAERPLLSLLPHQPVAAVLASALGPASCVSGLVAIEQLVPHAGSVSLQLRTRPQLSRLSIAPGDPELRRLGLRAQTPSVVGDTINVPVLPDHAGTSIVAALRDAPLYSCGG